MECRNLRRYGHQVPSDCVAPQHFLETKLLKGDLAAKKMLRNLWRLQSIWKELLVLVRGEVQSI